MFLYTEYVVGLIEMIRFWINYFYFNFVPFYAHLNCRSFRHINDTKTLQLFIVKLWTRFFTVLEAVRKNVLSNEAKIPVQKSEWSGNIIIRTVVFQFGKLIQIEIFCKRLSLIFYLLTVDDWTVKIFKRPIFYYADKLTWEFPVATDDKLPASSEEDFNEEAM